MYVIIHKPTRKARLSFHRKETTNAVSNCYLFNKTLQSHTAKLGNVEVYLDDPKTIKPKKKTLRQQNAGLVLFFSAS